MCLLCIYDPMCLKSGAAALRLVRNCLIIRLDFSNKKKIILNILDRNQTILSQPSFSVNVSNLAEFSVKLAVTWWVNTQETSTSASISKVQEEVVQAFRCEKISIPYPVQEVKVYRGEPNLPNQD